jgi:hypothetical protein
MITRAVGRNAYIRVERSHYTYPGLRPLYIFAIVVACIVLVATLFFVTGVYEETRGRFIDSLKKERELAETNKALNMELTALKQKGYMEYVTHKRLGLKRPDDKEVVVLR